MDEKKAGRSCERPAGVMQMCVTKLVAAQFESHHQHRFAEPRIVTIM